MQAARVRRALVVAAVVLAATLPRAQGKRPIAETDLFKFTWIADPQISPDGSTVAFVRVVVNEKENRYETSLFVVPTSGGEPARRLTSGLRDTSPRWSPDGKRLAFVRPAAGQPAGAANGRQQPGQIHLLQMDGGEARRLTDVPHGASAPAWSPDGKTIAFSTTATIDEIKGRERQEASGGGAPRAEENAAHKSDVKVITRAVYRANGNPSYVEPDRHAHIWTIAVPPPASSGSDPDPAPTQITSGEFDER